jgi:hypothetical protein
VRFAGLVHAAMDSVDVSDDLLMDMIRYVLYMLAVLVV